MNRSTLRIAIAILTLATAAVHFYLNIPMGGFDPVFTLNGLGYLALLTAFLVPIPFLAGREKLVNYVFMGFVAVTILAWVAIGEKDLSKPLGLIGYTDEAIEILLLASLWLHLRARA